jgi:hypothetical protein
MKSEDLISSERMVLEIASANPRKGASASVGTMLLYDCQVNLEPHSLSADRQSVGFPAGLSRRRDLPVWAMR